MLQLNLIEKLSEAWKISVKFCKRLENKVLNLHVWQFKPE